MPPSTVIPVLAYPDVAMAVHWLCDAFGFTERLRIGHHRAQLIVGEGAVVVTERRLGQGDSSDAAEFRRQRGERQYTAEDLGGHRWTFSQSIAGRS